MNGSLSSIGSVGLDSVGDLVFGFLTGRRQSTVRAYQYDLADFCRFTSDITLSHAVGRLLGNGVGPANWLAIRYRAHLLERGLLPATVNRRLAALRSLVKLARLFGLVAWELSTPGVRHEAYRDTRGPGKAAVQEMLALASVQKTPIALRNFAVLHLLYDLALRRGEVVSLNREDLDLVAGVVWVMGKGRREKSLLTLPSPTVDALAGWLTERGAVPGPLFTNFDRAKKGDGRLTVSQVYNIVRQLGEQIGIKARPHGLRHTAITEACKAAQRAGICFEEVLDFSRHKNVQVLMLYRDRERNMQGKLASLVAAGMGC